MVQSLLTIAEQEQHPPFLLAAHTLAGGARFCVGDLLAAHAHFVQCATLDTTKVHEEQVLFAGVDFGLVSLAFSTHTFWGLGHADQALRHAQTVVTSAHQLAHPFSQALGFTYLAMLHQFRRERDAAQAQAEAAWALAERHEVHYYGAWAAILARWAQASANPGQEEIDALCEALADFRATGSGMRWPYYLSLLAEVYAQAGQPAAGLATTDQALAAATTQGEHWWDAELHRLRGELSLSQGAAVEQVEAAFQNALDIARRQQARVLELRAATSLARLWRQSQTGQARRLLAAVYGQFDEGFDTRDLQEAKILLAELS